MRNGIAITGDRASRKWTHKPSWARLAEGINVRQEPITWSVQLSYSACETAFLQVELFLDIKAFTQISSQ